MTRFLPLGGAGEIGASCFYLDIHGTGIIIDSGIHPRKIGIEALPLFDLIKNLPVDAALISHAHQDHIGSLPYLVQRHPYLRIIGTPQTRAIAELTLHNSVSILQRQLQEDEYLHPYSHEEIDLLIQSMEWRLYDERFAIEGYRHQCDSKIDVQFFDAGHILGSAGILIEHDGMRLMYTGDINLADQVLHRGAEMSEKKCDVLIIECTHGGTDSLFLPDWQNESRRLAARANEIIEAGGAILIPVFSLGKMQEMLALLWQLMQKGILAEIDLYTGGVGTKINSVYDKNRYVVRSIDKEFELGTIPQKDSMELFDDIKLLSRPAIVLAASGMMIEGTTSFELAKRWLTQRNNAIFTVGYTDPETPGYRVANANTGEKLRLTDFSEEQVVRCSIDRFRFTAHARREQLIEIVRRVNPDRVILVHGDEPSIDWMGHMILEKYPEKKVHAARMGEWVEW